MHGSTPHNVYMVMLLYRYMNLVFPGNMNLVFHMSEDGSEIELKYYATSKTSVKSSRKYFVHIRLATNPNWLDSSIGRAAV